MLSALQRVLVISPIARDPLNTFWPISSDTRIPSHKTMSIMPADRLESAANVHIASDLYVRLNSQIALI